MEPPHVFSRRASFWVVAGIVSHTLWTSAAPAMTYPLQAEAWQLSQATITAIFAIYPLVVVAVLVGFGDLSDGVVRIMVTPKTRIPLLSKLYRIPV